jgi:hypothetical protein
MTADLLDVSSLEDPQRQLEQAFIAEFLRLRGYEPAKLDVLPVPERELLMKQASTWASGKLAEVDTRAYFVHEMHGDVEDTHKPPHR